MSAQYLKEVSVAKGSRAPGHYPRMPRQLKAPGLVERTRAALAPLGLQLRPAGGALLVASAAGEPMGRLAVAGGAVGLLGLRRTALMVDVAAALQGAGVPYRATALSPTSDFSVQDL